MAKGAYIGVGGVAHKIKGGYIGVNGVARKIKKAYIGVSGVARPCWGGGLEYYGTATALSVARGSFAGASNPNYAIFAGGCAGATSGWITSTAYSTVDAYDANLTKSSPTALSAISSHLAGASVGDYALFAGGASGTTIRNQVNAYNKSLTRSTPTALSQTRRFLAGASVGNYALFAGGCAYNQYVPYTTYTTVDAYNTSLTRSTPTALSVARHTFAGASNKNYALFAGGDTSTANKRSNVVDAYNTNLVRTTPTVLTYEPSALAGASTDNYAIFAGGGWGLSGGAYNIVNAYNSELVQTTPSTCRQSNALAGTSVKNYALFGGGTGTSVTAYDENLVRSYPKNFSHGGKAVYPAGASVGNYALFAGGFTTNSTGALSVPTTEVNVYTVV